MKRSFKPTNPFLQVSELRKHVSTLDIISFLHFDVSVPATCTFLNNDVSKNPHFEGSVHLHGRGQVSIVCQHVLAFRTRHDVVFSESYCKNVKMNCDGRILR